MLRLGGWEAAATESQWCPEMVAAGGNMALPAVPAAGSDARSDAAPPPAELTAEMGWKCGWSYLLLSAGLAVGRLHLVHLVLRGATRRRL